MCSRVDAENRFIIAKDKTTADMVGTVDAASEELTASARASIFRLKNRLDSVRTGRLLNAMKARTTKSTVVNGFSVRISHAYHFSGRKFSEHCTDH